MRVFKKISKFKNPHIDETRRKVSDFFKWFIGKYDDDQKLEEMPHTFELLSNSGEYKHHLPYVQWINHSTFTIQHGDIGFITDPIWSKRCSPLPFLGPKRKHEPPVAIEELGNIHFALISHNHYDHLDKPTVLKLNQYYPDMVWIVPKGVKRWFDKLKIQNVIELNWWEETIQIKERTKISVTAVPAQHFSGRNLFDKDKTLWAGFVVEIEKPFQRMKRFYFVGDTGYNEHDFKKIGKKFGRMDLSLIPIGAYTPRKFQSPVHINPEEAVKIHQEVGSKLSVGCHWNTFKLSYEEQKRPAYDLNQALSVKNLHPHTFQVLLPGEKLNW